MRDQIIYKNTLDVRFIGDGEYPHVVDLHYDLDASSVYLKVIASNEIFKRFARIIESRVECKIEAPGATIICQPVAVEWESNTDKETMLSDGEIKLMVKGWVVKV